MKPRAGPWLARWSVVLAAAMIGLALSACAAALWYVDFEGRRLIAAQEQETLADELDLFSMVQHEQGRAALIRAVNLRTRLHGAHHIYLLKDAQGRVLAGNASVWPAGVADNAPWMRVRDAAATGGEMRLSSRRLHSGLAVLAGRDRDAVDAFQADVLEAMWIAIAIVAVACLAMAGGATALILARVRRLSAVAARVSAGDFSARAPGAAAGGPFGEIARAQNAMLDRIEDLVMGLRTVTDSLAHDLRTPLSRMRGRIEAGLAAQSAVAKHEALEDALGEADKTIATFTALIDIARADGGLSREAMTQVDLAGLAADVHDLFLPLAEDRGVVLSLASAPASITGHKPLLMQAVSNLVHNAIKYAPADGRVALELAAERGGAEIVVSDNGPGIPAEKRAEALKRFSRLASAESPPEGVGLGLAIVEACARLHRGQLVLEDNAPGLRARLVLAAGV
jgi:signal transduction histidine kinase